MIEIEKRALLSQDNYNNIRGFLEDKAKKISEQKRFTLVKVSNKDFTPDPNNEIDIKIRTTTKESLFTVKKGNWHNSSGRKENEIHFKVEEIEELIEMLTSLGYLYFVAMYVTRLKYEYNGLIITIDKYFHMSDILLEIEKAVESPDEEAKATTDINDFLSEMNLNAMDSEKTIKFIESINLIEETRVDFSKVQVKDWVENWKNFISCNI